MAGPPDNARDLWLTRLSTLADPTRVRLLRLLEKQELGVGELSRAARLPQSTVSRHLKALHDCELVHKRSEGTATLYVLRPESLSEDAHALWQLTRARLGASPEFAEDDARLADVLSERRTDSRTYFGRLGGEWDRVRGDLFGDSFTAEALLTFVDPRMTVADIGCGTGQASELLSGVVSKVVSIDRESSMLDAARQRLGAAGNVEFRIGDILHLPARDAEFDAALAMLVLHHIEDPVAALREIRRTLKDGAALVVVDMVPHRHEEFRMSMGHRHLGFGEADLAVHASAAGLTAPRYRRLRMPTERRGPALFAASLRAR